MVRNIERRIAALAGARLGVTVALLSSAVSQVSARVVIVSGYRAETAAVVDALRFGPQIEWVKRSLSFDPPDWDNATNTFNRVVARGLALHNIASCGSETTLQRLPGCNTQPLARYRSFWDGSATFMRDFVSPILATATAHGWVLDRFAREELIMKSIVNEGMRLAVHTRVQAAMDLTCSQEGGGAFSRALEFVDEAWGLYASSESEGPIRLAEKRALQFRTEAEPNEGDHAAGESLVNVRLLLLFKSLQALVRDNRCQDLMYPPTSPVRHIHGLLRVPLVQGVLREAFESDPAQQHITGGGDGFIEVVEGWAFTRAILPALSACNATAAAIVRRNMDNIAQGEGGAFVPDGFGAVKTALESTYVCLGMSCDDVGAMVDPWKEELYLWEPCVDLWTTTWTSTSLILAANGASPSSLSVLPAVLLAVMLHLQLL
mmetsp:Transcript_49731/g.118550  ORF Transcript_49731/g.118550 Transcript_49731/m.118550 type:complete len:433 (-) Transcript_49731:304-1602(-)